jgi:NitT/TauT family transport system substrate-binding protein
MHRSDSGTASGLSSPFFPLRLGPGISTPWLLRSISVPELAAKLIVEGGFAENYDYALQTLTENPYGAWREYDAEDTTRFYALRLHDLGAIKSTPQQIIASGTDWRFLNEIKHELKA